MRARIQNTGSHPLPSGSNAQAQLTLEIEAARLAAVRHDAEDRAAMRAALDARAAHRAVNALTDKTTQANALEPFIEIDARFHAAVVKAAHNSVLTDLYRYFASAIIETIRQTETDHGLPEPSQSDHEALFDAITVHDPDAAAARTRRLFTGTIAALSPSTPTESGNHP